jgi:hypothetical protein
MKIDLTHQNLKTYFENHNRSIEKKILEIQESKTIKLLEAPVKTSGTMN